MAPHQLSAPEGNTAQAFPVGSEPATHETCGKMTALKSDPVTWEISDDERPHSLAHHAREGYGRQARSLNSVSASASVRPEDKQRAKLLADKVCIRGLRFVLRISAFVAVHLVECGRYFIAE